MKRVDLTGKTFHNWTVLKLAPKRNRTTFWICKCVCEKVGQVATAKLRNGHSKSCGCSKRNKLSKGEASFNALFRQYKRNAKRANREFKLDKSYFAHLVTSVCHYCGEAPSTIVKSRHNMGDFVYNGVDRKNNTKGYTLENSVTCCFTCNALKGKLNYMEFLDRVKRVYDHRI